MRLHRFYVSQPLGEDVVINDVSLIKQWAKVFRYTIDDFVILFNGDGNDITFSIKSLDKKECVLMHIKQTSSYIPNKKITLFVSCIKKDNFELIVQKVTELGVTSIVPLISERSEKKNLNTERLHKIAIEASEQSGRGDVPSISSILPLASALKMISQSKKENSFVLQVGGISFNDTELQKKIRNVKNVNLFIGPEGGWSPLEEAIFTEKCVIAVSLGQTVLRAETAAIVACAFMSNLYTKE